MSMSLSGSWIRTLGALILGLGLTGAVVPAIAQEAAVRRSLDLAPDATGAKALEVVSQAVAQAALAPVGHEVSINTWIGFAFDSAALTPEAEAQIAYIAAAMQGPQNQGARFLIEGHTDSRGAEAYNLSLSQRRAQSVLNRLRALGIPPQRISAVGFGETRLLAGVDPGAAIQRRVEFVILR